jgi:dual specificity protein kinase YAK1
MDSQWQSYPDPAGAPRRNNGAVPHQQMPRDYAPPHQQHQQHQQQQQPPAGPAPAGYKYDHYHGGAGAAAAGGANPAASPMAGTHMHDGNGDVAMHDAHDAHAGIKYPMRPHHQSHPSGGRTSNLHSPQEAPSAAAQRYSPMDTLAPTSPYNSKPNQFGNPPPQRQSPAKQGEYPQSPYYPGRQQPGQQLPPINPYGATQDGYPSSAIESPFSMDPKSPRRQAPMPATRGPVPEFKKVRGTADLRPKNNHQPPFRRANPEGGFISVCSTHSLVNDRPLCPDSSSRSLCKH